MNKPDSIGVYAHIPYCASKCPYCAFNSTAAVIIPEVRYTDCILKELDYCLENEGLGGRCLESLYIGGGTPSLFSPAAIGRLVKGIKTSFAASTETETTLEVNPDSVDAYRMEAYLAAGVTRVSIGAQSFDDAVLKTLGRRHSADKAASAVKAAFAAGFENIGVDLIFMEQDLGGVPGQALDSWKRSLAIAIELRPRHISVYGLTLEEDTPFYSLYGKTDDREAAEEKEALMYEAAIEALKGAGYLHYEISNFALPGFESRHNRRYWLGGDYIGLGAGAHSFFSAHGWGRRRWNTEDAASYMGSIEAAGAAAEGVETLTEHQARTEAALLGLRMLDKGIDGAAFKARFGVSPSEAFHDIKALEKEGLLLSRGEDVLLTQKGALISNEILGRL